MIIIPIVVFGPTQLANAATSVHQTALNGLEVLTRVVLTNVSAAPRIISIWIGRGGAAAADADLIVDSKSLSVDESWICNELAGLVLGSLDKIYMMADVATSVNATGSGYGVK